MSSRLDLKQSRLESKVNNSVQTRLKRLRLTTEVFEAVSAASADSRKEEIVLNVVETAPSSALTEERSITMKKLLVGRTPDCCIDDAEHTNFVRQYELGAGEGVNKNVDVV